MICIISVVKIVGYEKLIPKVNFVILFTSSYSGKFDYLKVVFPKIKVIKKTMIIIKCFRSSRKACLLTTILLFIIIFFFPLFLGGKGITKVMVKSHAFLLDQWCIITNRKIQRFFINLLFFVLIKEKIYFLRKTLYDVFFNICYLYNLLIFMLIVYIIFIYFRV